MAVEVKAIQFLCIPLVHGPGLTCIEQGGEDDGSVDSFVDRLTPLCSHTNKRWRPKAEIALAIVASVLSSMCTLRERVLPRYVNLSTAAGLCPFTVTVGSW